MQGITLEGFRLSPQQKRLWTLQHSHPELYGAHCAVLIQGPLHQARLKRAIEQVIERHEILRTSFQSPPAMTIPLQVINQSSELAFDHHDWQRLTGHQQSASLNELFTNIPQVSAALERCPRWQLPLLRLAQDRYAAIISLPALYTDTLGLRNLVAEISRCCRGTLGRSKRGHPAAWEHQEYISWEQSFSGVQESLTAARYFPLCFATSENDKV